MIKTARGGGESAMTINIRNNNPPTKEDKGYGANTAGLATVRRSKQLR